MSDKMFAYSVAGIGVILLALAWFLVIGPLTTLTAKEQDLNAVSSKVKGWLRKREYPSEKAMEYEEKGHAVAQKNYAEAKSFIEDKRDRFNRYLDESTERPAPGDFYPPISDAINHNADLAGGGKNGLRVEYRKQFGIKVDAELPDADQIPIVDINKLEEINNDPDLIPVTMKQYWIAESIFQACK